MRQMNAVLLVTSSVLAFAVMGSARGMLALATGDANVSPPAPPAGPVTVPATKSASAADRTLLPLKVPRVDDAGGTDVPADWGAQGLMLTQLAGEAPEPTTYDHFGAQARLGWNDQGLVAWVDVADDSPSESVDVTRLSDGDSVEFMVSGANPKDGLVQVVAAPGRTAMQPVARVRVQDYREPHVRARLGVATGRAVVKRSIHGYQVELVVPWSNFGAAAQPGDIRSARITVNGRTADDQVRTRWYLLMPGQAYDFFALPSVQLTGKGPESGSPVVVSWVRYDEFLTAVRVNVVAPVAWQKAPVEVWSHGRKLASGKLVADGPRCLSALYFPAPGPGAASPELMVRVRGRVVPTVPLPDLVAERKRVFLTGFGTRTWTSTPPAIPAWTTPVFAKTVFDSEVFPTFGYPDLARIKAIVGEVTTKLAFYDDDGKLVDRATQPGRYGAVATVTTADGTVGSAYVTLFRRSPGQANAGDAVALAALTEAGPGTGAGRAVDAEKVDRDWWHGLRQRLGTAVHYEYFAHTPARYESEPSKRWPVLFFLHGSGGGDKFESVQTAGPQEMFMRQSGFPFIVVSLRSPGGWSPPAVKDVMDEVASKFRIDPDRVYLAGFSMGAMGTWDIVLDQPKRFAAAVVVGGRRGHPDRAQDLKATPFSVWNGVVDTATAVEDARIAVAALRAAGGSVTYTELPGVGHTDSHDLVFRDPALYEWLLQHRRAH